MPKNDYQIAIHLSPEQKALLETARKVVKVNGLSTTTKSVILLGLKALVERQQNLFKEQYGEKR